MRGPGSSAGRIPKILAGQREAQSHTVASGTDAHRANIGHPFSSVSEEPARIIHIARQVNQAVGFAHHPDPLSAPVLMYTPGGAPAAATGSPERMIFPAGLARRRFLRVDGGR